VYIATCIFYRGSLPLYIASVDWAEDLGIDRSDRRGGLSTATVLRDFGRAVTLTGSAPTIFLLQNRNQHLKRPTST
ncbi:hypothetical protein BDR03DRAFT_956669, partial [Suillus americanus]